MFTSMEYLEFFFDAWDRIFIDSKEYFTTCLWMNDIYRWKQNRKIFMDVGNIHFFSEHVNKRNKVEAIYVGLFWNFHHMKCSSCTLTCTSYFFNIKYIQALQHLNHVNFLIKSNSMAYKLVDPSRGMCSLWIEKIWGSPWHLTLSIPFKVVFYFHSLSQTLTSWTILATYIIKLHSYPFYY
jgi:hypothetical protein